MTQIKDRTSLFYETIMEEKMFANKAALQFQMDELFGNIDFKNKTFLDIGGGSGLFCFYAANQGAKEAVCLEPSDDGSSNVVIDKFYDLKNKLNYDNVTLVPKTLQEYDPESKSFDIILLQNSINHLNEDACINLLNDNKNKRIYRELFDKIFNLGKPNSKIIICDCSSKNFYAALGIHNPFGPTIEWHKHQAPKEWITLLKESGFINQKTDWSSFNRLGPIGKFFIGNKLAAYFLRSHFKLTMDRP